MRKIQDKDGNYWEVTERINLAGPNAINLHLKCENGQTLDVPCTMSNEELTKLINAKRPEQSDTINEDIYR
ncbi:MAG: hypothetical protein IIC00_16465 [Planctomycetes bacterium]|nr:hypothetical protein [Planctomycetota bacterium]